MAEVGRPPKWETVEQVQSLIDSYFADTPKEEWTITGLALSLDTTRQTLLDYEHKDEFTDAIKKAKLKVENGYELDLKKSGRSGTIFALKNFDWRDKQEVDHTTKGESINDSKEVKDLTNKLNEIYRSTSSTSDGGQSSTVGTETPNKD